MGFVAWNLKLDFSHFRFETEGTQLPCKAVINLSDLRIPLMWKDSDHFKNKGGMYKNCKMWACHSHHKYSDT